jgi:hypothetical protein
MHRFADDPMLTDAMLWWLGLPPQDGVPPRSALDPTGLPAPLFPHVAVAEVIDGGDDLRFRLVGQELVARYGINVAGRTLVELTDGDHRRYLLDHVTTILALERPVYSESRFDWTDAASLDTRRLMLPFRDVGGAIDRLLIAQTFGVDAAGGPPLLQSLDRIAAADHRHPAPVVWHPSLRLAGTPAALAGESGGGALAAG